MRFYRFLILLKMISKSDEFFTCSCCTHQLVLFADTLITIKSHTVFYILESCPAHHFVKLFLAILWSDYQEAAMEVLQVTKLGHGILYVCGMFHLEKLSGIWRSLNQMTSTVLARSVRLLYENLVCG